MQSVSICLGQPFPIIILPITGGVGFAESNVIVISLMPARIFSGKGFMNAYALEKANNPL